MNFFKNYILGDKIGSGGFGEVFRCIHEKGNPFAVKIEKPGKNVLKNEFQLIKKLNKNPNPYIYMVYEYGIVKDSGRNCMVMELLGDNLSKKLQKYGIFNEKNLLNVGLMMINAIEYIHMKGYVHRDIKPENFAFNLDERRLYMMDFGLAKHISKIKYRENKNLVGTARYASINAHMGIEVTFRDDIESMVYSLIYLGKGKLPWQGLTASNKAKKHLKIKNVKQNIQISDLCSDLSSPIEQILISCFYLDFSDKPNYDYFKILIQDKLKEKRYSVNQQWNWGNQKK